jgi:benzoylsuccinyl-CoA thiolase BbsA subunit
MTGTGKEQKKNREREPDITFFHSDLFEVPQDGSPPYLKGYRCKKCGQLDFPKLSLCANCWGEEFEMVALSKTGELYSYAEILVGQPGMETPYTIGYIDLPEKIRVFAQLEGAAGFFQCGDQMEVTAGTIRINRDGLPLTSYKFRKVKP